MGQIKKFQDKPISQVDWPKIPLAKRHALANKAGTNPQFVNDETLLTKPLWRAPLTAIFQYVKGWFKMPLDCHYQQLRNAIEESDRSLVELAKEYVLHASPLPEELQKLVQGRKIKNVLIKEHQQNYQLLLQFEDSYLAEHYSMTYPILEAWAILRYQHIYDTLLQLKANLPNDEEGNGGALTMEILIRIANRFLDLKGRKAMAQIVGVSPLNITNCVIRLYHDECVLEIRRLDSAITGVGTEMYALTRLQIETFIINQYELNKTLDQAFRV